MQKKIILFVIFTLFGYAAIAQNVGIGEANPSEKLDVNGRIIAKGYKNTILTDEGTTTISLTTINQWIDVPDLSETFTLDEATTVVSSYIMPLRNQSPFGGVLASARLVIDGTAYSPASSSFVLNATHPLTNAHTMELAAGSHTIKVQYYLSGTGPYQSFTNGFVERKLQILIFGSN